MSKRLVILMYHTPIAYASLDKNDVNYLQVRLLN